MKRRSRSSPPACCRGPGIHIDADGEADVRCMTVWPLADAMPRLAPTPRRDNRAMDTPLRLGILGCANIARQFAAHVAPSPAVRIVAAASRDAAKAAAFASEFGLPRHHASYEALLDDDGIDAVYIPLPNNLHARWAIAAAQSGKHVLCEKPLALGRIEAQSMFDAARRHSVFLLESYPWWFQPQTAALNALLREIGEVRAVQAAFTFTLANAQTNIRMQPELGGGALLDAGSYPVSFVRLVMGEAPQRVQATSTWAESGVDIATTATLHFGGCSAQIACAMNTAPVRQALVCGTRGIIDTEWLNHTGAPTLAPLAAPRGGGSALGTARRRTGDGFLPSRLRVRRGTAVNVAFEDVASATGSGFRFAAEAFAKVIAQRDDAAIERAAQASLDIAATLEAIARSAREGTAIDL